MPRIDIDYSKGLIYKIVCNDIKIKETYYGSTTNFKARKYAHKNSCCNENNNGYLNPKYLFIRNNGGWENWSMILVKEFSCNSKLELEKKERLCMEQDEFRLNAYKPFLTEEEKKEYDKKYREEHVEENKKYNEKYYKENKEQLNKQRNKKCDCVCGSTYTYKNKSTHIKTKKHQKYINNLTTE